MWLHVLHFKFKPARTAETWLNKDNFVFLFVSIFETTEKKLRTTGVNDQLILFSWSEEMGLVGKSCSATLEGTIPDPHCCSAAQSLVASPITSQKVLKPQSMHNFDHHSFGRNIV